MLTIAVSSRSLFHIEDGHQIFVSQGQEAFNEYMRSKENVPLRPGTAFPLVKKLLKLNSYFDRPAIRVVLLSRNSPDAGLRIMNSVHHYGIGVEHAIFSQGSNRFRYAKAFGAQLFLSANESDVRCAIEQGLAAAQLMPAERVEDTPDDIVRFAFDGDSVLFSSEADEYYRAHGLDKFRQYEADNAHLPLGPGPFKPFLEELHKLQQGFTEENSPLRVALVTARGLPAHGRVMHTLRSWGIRLDEVIFAAGCPKGPLLEAFGADIFFDDTQKNIDSALSSNIASGHVLYGRGQGIVAPTTEAVEPVRIAA